MTKYPLSAIKSYFLLGHQVQIQLVLVLDQKLNFMAQNTISGKKNNHKTAYKCSYSNQHHFQCLVYKYCFNIFLGTIL